MVLIPFILTALPESLSYMTARNDKKGLRKVLLKMQPDLKLEEDFELILPAADKQRWLDEVRRYAAALAC